MWTSCKSVCKNGNTTLYYRKIAQYSQENHCTFWPFFGRSQEPGQQGVERGAEGDPQDRGHENGGRSPEGGAGFPPDPVSYTHLLGGKGANLWITAPSSPTTATTSILETTVK